MKSAVGLDISDHTIEVVELKKSGKQAEVLASNRIALPAGVVEKGRIRDEKKLGETLKKLFAEAKPNLIKPNYVIFGLPESQVYTHAFRLAELSEEEIARALPDAIRKVVPIDSDDLVFAYRVLGAKKQKKSEQQGTDVLVVATSRIVVEEWQQFFQSQHIDIDKFDIESLALFRGLGLNSQINDTICLVDVGSHTTTMSFFIKDGLIYTQTNHIGGNAFTEAIAARISRKHTSQKQKKSKEPTASEEQTAGQKAEIFASAEGEKISHGLRHQTPQIRQALTERADILIQQLQDVIAYVEKKQGVAIGNVILMGGSAKMKGLAEYVAEQIDKNIQVGASALVGDKMDPVYTGAIGLAWRGVDKTADKQDIAIPIERRRPSTSKLFKKVKDTEDNGAEQTGEVQIEEDGDDGDSDESPRTKKQLILLGSVFLCGALLFVLAFWYRGNATAKREAAKRAAEEALGATPAADSNTQEAGTEEKNEDSHSGEVFSTTTDPAGEEKLSASSTQTGIQTPTSSPEQFAEVLPTGIGYLNVRGGGGLSFSVVEQIGVGKHFPVVEINTTSEWVKLQIDEGVEGWVSSEYVRVYTYTGEE